MPPQVLKAGSRPPWVGLAAAVWVQIAAGNTYNFPLYSSALKSVMGYNQQQVTFLGVANDIGENIGILPGIACNKFPPWAVMSVGAVACFLGYGVLWLAVSQTVQGLPYWLLWIALCVATNSSAWYGTAVLVTNMRNFPLSRGTVAGLLKGYIGISAAVYTAIYNFKKFGPRGASSDKLAEGDSDSTPADPLLLTPSSSEANLGNFHESEYTSDVEYLLAVGEGAVKKKRRPRRGEEFKFHEAFIKADFWLLWFVYFLGVGSGVTVLNNLAQIGIALGVSDTTILLSLFSFCNFLGRLGGGAVSEHFVRSNMIPRTIWMTLAQTIMVVAFLLYASGLNGTLYAATALLGVCYGVQFSIMIPTASELFGLKHFGIIFNFMGLGNPIGALLFSGLMAGKLYDAEAAKQGSSTCVGTDCFKVTFLILAGMCGLGTLLSIILSVRIRPVYQMLYAGGSFRIAQTSGH
ncbi:protein NUCLEAR FUSION DEFECTIVE 4 isoform X2 [Punica granatum]|uniref:Protein NUCLEAR FUSION DEFECTIVE 4 isoform X2 n=1 Tax=Punica granatum TaxID=22663 RepID=A0A6P8CUT2_PUNGR|nr:protein NUCLEAR FUSION DEFECTIVE 4 isoform X2 [Punica granatum]